jgi:hypothetical protein
MSAIVEQLPYGFRYRVTEGAKGCGALLAASTVYEGIDQALYALQARYPGIVVIRVKVIS